MTEIDGSTRLFAIVGWPVSQVKAPGLLNAHWSAARINRVMVPVAIEPTRFDATFASLLHVANLDGVVVTLPYKERATRFAARLGPAARATGCVNALRRDQGGAWVADLFDGAGFVNGLRSQGIQVDGKAAFVLGAGGAGTSIVHALLGHGASRVECSDIDPRKLHALSRRMGMDGRLHGVSSLIEPWRFDLLINATPLGLRDDDPLPFDPRLARADAVVADVIMQPEETRLLRLAASAGMRVHHGAHMLSGQLDLLDAFFSVALDDRAVGAASSATAG